MAKTSLDGDDIRVLFFDDDLSHGLKYRVHSKSEERRAAHDETQDCSGHPFTLGQNTEVVPKMYFIVTGSIQLS